MQHAISSGTCAIALAVLWWMFTEGDGSSWVVGVPTILVAVVSTRLLARAQSWPRFSLAGLMRFVPFFFKRCFVAGLDVARLALSGRQPLQPALLKFYTRLPQGYSRVAFVSVISLLPGTLSADIDDDCLTIHLLDSQQNNESELRQVEHAVARVFRVELGEPSQRVT